MFTGIKGLLFDLDGTLADSLWIWPAIDVEFLGEYGIDCPGGIQEDLGGSSFYEVAVYFKNRFDIPLSLSEIMDRWNDMARDKYAREIPLKEGVRSFLLRAREKNYKMAIASSNSRVLVEEFLKKEGIDEFIDTIVSSDEAANGKPAPDVYLMAAKKLGLKNSECFVFEDIPDGIRAGKAAGCRVCAMEDRFSADKREEKRLLADYYADSFAELEEFL